MFAGFTARSRDALALAKSEAQRLRHDFIGTEHLLLGLIQEGTGVAAIALAALGVMIERARDEVARLVPPGPAGAVKAYLPLTPRLRQAMDEARLEAQKLGHDFIGTEHLLLGLLDVPGVAGQALTNLGLYSEKVREEISRQIGSSVHGTEARSTSGGSVTYWPAGAAQRYKIGANEFRVAAGASDTDGAYCAIEMAVAGADGLGMRAHGREDVSIHVIEGNVRLRVQDRVIEMSAGDFCRVPRATMHEFQPGEQPAKLMLITTPAGVEKFFVAAAQATGRDAVRQIASQHGVTLE
jgi:mannose-6-phosphate isomerase-like protein (cupin superfamily)